MPNNVIITGYFCGIYEKSEPDSDEADRLMIHVKGEKKCDVCNIIGDMNGSINEATRRRRKRNERLKTYRLNIKIR